MKTWRLTIVLFTLTVGALSGCIGKAPMEKPTAEITATEKPQSISTVTSEPVSTLAPTPDKEKIDELIKGFAGKWIAYNTVSLKTGLPANENPSTRLEIANTLIRVDNQTCTTPSFSVKNIQLDDFLNGYPAPNTSISFYETNFPFLSTGCNNLDVSAVALVNSRTLAAVKDSQLVFFEPDNSVKENDLIVVSTLVSENSADPLYEIHAQLPVLEAPDSQKLNDLAKKMVTGELEGFKKQFKDWEIPPEMAKQTSFMWIGYDVPLLTENFVSMRFYVDYYMAGAAHPNHYFKVLNYDRAAGKEIPFNDLFKDVSAGLNYLAKACKADLSKPDFPLFEEGLTPSKENFTNWNLTEDGLRISFDPYQVAPYAAGPQEVVIPFKDLKNLVNEKTSVGAFIAR